MRECGECTLCCKVMAVTVISKPTNVWCEHCDKAGGGCKIYDHRPKACREFECLWLMREAIPEEFKPSKSRVVMVPNQEGNGLSVQVDPGMKDAWKEESLLRYLQGLSRHMTVVADTGTRAYQIVPFGYRELGPHQIKRSGGMNGFLVTQPGEEYVRKAL
jgi:hypothetical protein